MVSKFYYLPSRDGVIRFRTTPCPRCRFYRAPERTQRCSSSMPWHSVTQRQSSAFSSSPVAVCSGHSSDRRDHDGQDSKSLRLRSVLRMDVRGCACISSVTTIGKMSWESASCQDSSCLRPESGFGLRAFLEDLQIFVCIYVYVVTGLRTTYISASRLLPCYVIGAAGTPHLLTPFSVGVRDEEFQ